MRHGWKSNSKEIQAACQNLYKNTRFDETIKVILSNSSP